MEKSKIKNQSRTFSILLKVLNFKGAGWFVILIFGFCILHFIGCATIKETAKGIAGVSTTVLEKGRKDAIIKTFNYDYNTCYNKVEGILKHIGAYIYAKDQKKQMIAIYASETDTTVVGLFFKSIDTKNTQIEVSSPSTYAKEFISAKIFSALEPEPKEEESYEKK